MRKERSKKKIWIRSFILLPVVALLLFSFSTTVQQEKATPQQVVEYNTLAKKYNEQPKKGMVLKLKEVNRIEYLYKLMTPSQKKKAEKYPNFPPPPPIPAEASEADIKKYKKFIKIYDKEIKKAAHELNRIDGIVYKDEISNIPPPLPKNAKYILNNKKVSYEEISKVSNDKIQSVDIITKDNNGKKLNTHVFYIYTKKETKTSYGPKTLINGVTCNQCTLELTKGELAKMVVTIEKGKVTEFKIKFPKKPTVTVSNSNALNKEAKEFLEDASVGQMAQLFNLKSSESELKSPPVIFKIIE